MVFELRSDNVVFGLCETALVMREMIDGLTMRLTRDVGVVSRCIQEPKVHSRRASSGRVIGGRIL